MKDESTPRVISVTGGIGVGKSFVLRKIREAGYPVYYADIRAKQLMEEDAELREAIEVEFGKAAYTAQGNLNRSYIASIIFSSPEKRKALNALVHPKTISDFTKWAKQKGQEGHKVVFKEAALTLEANALQADMTLVVVYA
ncbi:MAG: dephospho-CoA kinase, partial [Bacteroidia bacterium]|nr:dephospho-CoA kinase [Bacteroidia bacterium]MDW8135055.1 dephospho-CoA kinase [Bacteroidia bacterium]